jgi:hypothetical protein
MFMKRMGNFDPAVGHTYTGWADESWTACAGPPLPPLGGCEEKNYQKMKGGGPGDGVNGVGDGRSLGHQEDHLRQRIARRQRIAQKPMWGSNIRDWTRHQELQMHGFQCEKAVK